MVQFLRRYSTPTVLIPFCPILLSPDEVGSSESRKCVGIECILHLDFNICLAFLCLYFIKSIKSRQRIYIYLNVTKDILLLLPEGCLEDFPTFLFFPTPIKYEGSRKISVTFTSVQKTRSEYKPP